ncbi:MAG: phosphonopyruvate decarboxylase [Clostridia bacterium]|nr:phosphonopyruvate decarboxylase [Clostridia bacterium]
MNASILVDVLMDSGIDFFTGVPDSFLKGLCDELYGRFGTESVHHIVAHNEGGAVGLCAGHYLATGKPALCYMQNSGLGNAVNPLASLMDPRVYGLPCLLVVGWRGEPGTKDEPQHVMQGEITLGQLDLLGIPWKILDSDTTEKQFRNDFGELEKYLSAGKCAALVVKKGALVSSFRPDYSNHYAMRREKAAEILLASMGEQDVVVSTTGKLSREIFEIRERNGGLHDHDFLTVGSMGHASMIALGMAEALPGRRIWCLDGDGAVLMHMGALPVIGKRSPARFVHVVINNGAHETVGGMPVCSGGLNLRKEAEAAGYAGVLSADSEETLKAALKSITDIEANGPVLLEVCCACGARGDLGRPSTTPKENRDALMKFITKS